MTKYDLYSDLSTVTTIPKLSFDKLSVQAIKCICHDVYESIEENEDIVTVDIGFGDLIIKFSDNELKFRFQPNQKFESTLIDTIKNGESPIIQETEDILIKKIISTYKDLFK